MMIHTSRYYSLFLAIYAVGVVLVPSPSWADGPPSQGSVASTFINFNAAIGKCDAAQLEAAITRFTGNLFGDMTISLGNYGGDTGIALSVYAFIKSMPLKKLTTYSRAGIDFPQLAIFLSGKDRIASPGTNILFRQRTYHISNQQMTASKYKRIVIELEGEVESVIKLIRNTPGVDAASVEKAIREEKILSAEEAMALGIVTDIRDVQFLESENGYTIGYGSVCK